MRRLLPYGKRKRGDLMQCVICGAEIPEGTEHKAWPVVSVKGASCCRQCKFDVVDPVTFRTLMMCTKGKTTGQVYYDALLQQKRQLERDLRAISRTVELWETQQLMLLSAEVETVMGGSNENERK